MDNKEILKSVLNSIINDDREQASLDLHNYIARKMNDVSEMPTEQLNSMDND